jgi:hypothetical protein
MIKGGVITGKVVTADNDPVVAVRVRALRIRDLNGRRPARLELSPDRLTDDRGIYRIFGLLPGTYLVYAGGRGLLRDRSECLRQRCSYVCSIVHQRYR